MPKLFCIVVGHEGSPFPVDVAAEETVGDLKDKIKEKKKMITCDADELELYLARNGLSRDEAKAATLDDDGNVPGCIKMDELLRIQNDYHFGMNFQPEEGKIYVLVVVREVQKTKDKWTALELSTIAPEVQWKLWKSVVRVVISISSCVEDTGTALVVDRTPTHLYLLTNLHLFLDEEFSDGLSDDFTKEIQRYSKLHPGKKPSGKRKKDAANISAPSIRRSKRVKKVPVSSDIFQIAIEQLFPDEEELKEVYKFSLESSTCWRCSADFDFAIFEVPTPPNVQLELVRCEMAYRVFPTMPVHVFGFPGSLDGKFDHHYAIIPAAVTGTNRNQMTLSTLSAPGLSGSAIVCTKRGIPVGYMGGGFDGSSENEQYQSYGFTLQGMPQDLPSALPLQDDEETKEEAS
ncbi:hypothetical protein Ae201684P_005324 [Aphanomyces euteiches]|nr:hypothetical protein Ae201684P_005324 [Aphanomyces euteiches]